MDKSLASSGANQLPKLLGNSQTYEQAVQETNSVLHFSHPLQETETQESHGGVLLEAEQEGHGEVLLEAEVLATSAPLNHPLQPPLSNSPVQHASTALQATDAKLTYFLQKPQPSNNSVPQVLLATGLACPLQETLATGRIPVQETQPVPDDSVPQVAVLQANGRRPIVLARLSCPLLETPSPTCTPPSGLPLPQAVPIGTCVCRPTQRRNMVYVYSCQDDAGSSAAVAQESLDQRSLPKALVTGIGTAPVPRFVSLFASAAEYSTGNDFDATCGFSVAIP